MVEFDAPRREPVNQWSCSVVSNSLQPHGLEPTRILHPWNFPGKNTGGGCHFLKGEGSVNPSSHFSSSSCTSPAFHPSADTVFNTELWPKGNQRASSLPLSVTFWARYYVTLAILSPLSHYHQQFLELKKQRITALPAQPRAADCCHEHLFLKKWNSSSHFHPQSCRGRLEILYMFQISKWKGM